MRLRRRHILLTIAVPTLVAVSACAPQAGPNEVAPIAAQLSVERFLQADVMAKVGG